MWVQNILREDVPQEMEEGESAGLFTGGPETMFNCVYKQVVFTCIF